MDAIVQVAFYSFVGTVVTAFGAVIVAMVNNKRERKGSAHASMEATLRERILLRDEEIVRLEKKNLALREENMALKAGSQNSVE